MKLLFRQRLFSWFDSYDIYDEDENTVFVVKGQLSWGHRLVILDAEGNTLGVLQEVVLALLPRFEITIGGEYVGCIRKEFTLFKPKFTLDFNGWRVEGGWLEWNYQILDPSGRIVASISKELFHWTDTYAIDVSDPGDALSALLVVLAIDAEKCSRGS